MPLPDEVIQQISTFVRAGFESRGRIVEILCEETYEPGELDRSEVEFQVNAAFTSLKSERRRWPEVTDCDKLDLAFAALLKRGVMALQNAGYTQSDGYHDVLEAVDGQPDKTLFVGYCFYHGQDLERVVQGGGLHLAFGPIDPRTEQTEGVRVGQIVVSELAAQGFEVEWPGTFDKRIFVPRFDWKRRAQVS